MIFIFSTSNKIGSRLIRWGLNSKVSHFAVSEANICDSFVLDSTLEKNVFIKKLYEFKYTNKIVYAFECPDIDIKISQAMFTKLHSNLYNVKYDYKGVAWLGLTVLFCKKLFKRPLPKHNQWADKKDFFCSEIAYIIRSELALYCDIKIENLDQMLTPDLLLDMFLKSDKVKQCYILCDDKQRFLK